jgi:carboxymethylenebutenolidase
LRDRTYCNELEKFIDEESIDTIVGFCIGANFLFELVQRGYRGKCLAIYPLPWGMENEDAIAPSFDYMPNIDHPVTIVMGEQDPLAGPDNIEKMRTICSANPSLDLHLYEGSGHGFLNDVEGEDEKLRDNAFNALHVSLATVFHEKDNDAIASMLSDRMRQV